MDRENNEQWQPESSLNMLQHEAKELLMSIVMMFDVLQQQTKQPLDAQQKYFVAIMYELVIHALEIFADVYNVQAEEVLNFIQKNRLFVLNHRGEKEELHQQLLKKLYLLDAMNTITINELLDGFNDTSGNILIGTAQRIKSLIMVLELLMLRLQKEQDNIA